MRRNKSNRTIRLQIMVTPALAEKVSARSERLGITISSMGELLLSKALAAPRSSIKLNLEEI